MSPAAVCLATIFAIVAVGTIVGFLAGVRRRMDLEQWTVGGRGFGVALVFLLMAGEVYTTFAFLGASGWAYSRGGPTLYVLAYLTLAYVVSFFILPQIWEVGRRHGMQTQSDFFLARYGNPWLAGFVCIVGIVCFVPYLQLQITGVGLIVSIASYDGIAPGPAMAVAVALLVAFVCASGVRAVAWVSIVKDVLMVFAALAIGIGVPLIHFGGIGPMFQALAHAHPAHLTMPGATRNLGHAWFISTVLLTSLGFYMWPHSFAASFTAQERRHPAPQRGGDAAVHPDTGLHLLRRLCSGAGGARPVERRSGAAHGGAPELSALVSRCRGRGRRAHRHGAGEHLHPHRRHAVRQESVSPAVRTRHERCAGCQAGARHGGGARAHQPVSRAV